MKKGYDDGDVLAHVERLGELPDDAERQIYLRSLAETSPQLAKDVASLFEESTEHSIFDRVGNVAGRAMAELDSLHIPDMQSVTFARYVIDEPIGEGATSRVYSAKDVKTGRKVAIKFFAERHADLSVNEAFFLSKISHPNVVDLIDRGVWELEFPYLVFRQHLSLSKKQEILLDRLQRARTTYLQLLATVLYLDWDFKILNRDIKPPNLYRWYNQTLIGDFGIAAFSTGLEPQKVGTEGFVAPEIWAGDACASFKSELYSVMATVFWMLTHEHPHYDNLESQLGRHFASVWRRKLLKSFQAHLSPDPSARPVQIPQYKHPETAIDRGLMNTLQALINRERRPAQQRRVNWNRFGKHFPGSFQNRWF